MTVLNHHVDVDEVSPNSIAAAVSLGVREIEARTLEVNRAVNWETFTFYVGNHCGAHDEPTIHLEFLVEIL